MRYGSPGECIVHDKGQEFCNDVCTELSQTSDYEVRVITTQHPQSNGQAEVNIRTWKERMRALMSEPGYKSPPKNWDQTLFHTVLGIMRFDPSVANGYAPSELILGRQILFPFQLSKQDIDFAGNFHFLKTVFHFLSQNFEICFCLGVEFSKPIIDGLRMLHNKNFEDAAQKNARYQCKYKQRYDKKEQCSKIEIEN